MPQSQPLDSAEDARRARPRASREANLVDFPSEDLEAERAVARLFEASVRLLDAAMPPRSFRDLASDEAAAAGDDRDHSVA